MLWQRLYTVSLRDGAFRRAALGLLLGLVVVFAAGVTGPVRFGGPRWVPNISFGSHRHHFSRHWLIKAPGRGTGSLPEVIFWVLAGVVAVGAVVLLWWWLSGRRSGIATGGRPAASAAVRDLVIEPETPDAGTDVESLRSGVELALRSLEEHREPADAIVEAWLGLQELAAGAGVVRGAAETPTEFTSRVLRGAFADDWAIRTLLVLYLRARFGDRPVLDEDVAVLRRALQSLVDTWRAPDSPDGRVVFA